MRHILIRNPSQLSIRTSDYIKTGGFLSGWTTVNFLARNTCAVFVTIRVQMPRQFSSTLKVLLVITGVFIDDTTFVSKNTPLLFFVDKKRACRSDSLGR